MQLDHAPLTARTLRAADALSSNSPQEQWLDTISNYIANLAARGKEEQQIRFREITNPEGWHCVRELRRRWYPAVLPYLGKELNDDGSDEHDRHSFVYAAFVDDRAVATIRATCYPFETLRHVSEAELARFLGTGWKQDYVEWGRLLVEPGHGRLRLAQALVTYAGLRLLLATPYRRYFGYTKPNVRRVFTKFGLETDTLRFEIPSRGNHRYVLTKGSITTAVVRELPKWWRQVSKHVVGVRRIGSLGF